MTETNNKHTPHWIKINPKISVGNIMVLITWLVAIVLAYAKLVEKNNLQDKDISDIVTKISGIVTKINDNETSTEKEMGRMRQNIENIHNQLSGFYFNALINKGKIPLTNKEIPLTVPLAVPPDDGAGRADY